MAGWMLDSVVLVMFPNSAELCCKNPQIQPGFDVV